MYFKLSKLVHRKAGQKFWSETRISIPWGISAYCPFTTTTKTTNTRAMIIIIFIKTPPWYFHTKQKFLKIFIWDNKSKSLNNVYNLISILRVWFRLLRPLYCKSYIKYIKYIHKYKIYTDIYTQILHKIFIYIYIKYICIHVIYMSNILILE